MLSIKALAPHAATLLFVACASAPAPDYPVDHPANPQATAAPVTPQPSALAAYRSAQPAGATPAPANDSQKKENPHAGHH